MVILVYNCFSSTARKDKTCLSCIAYDLINLVSVLDYFVVLLLNRKYSAWDRAQEEGSFPIPRPLIC